MDLTYFNPNSQKELDFLASFVARQSTLTFFLKQLRLICQGQTARHHLIVAPRGFGKTSLLRRIAIGIRQDEQLNKHFIALRFREEQHNVISLDVFWRNCLQSLAEAREDEGAGQEELAALDADWERHAPRQPLSQAEQDGEPAWQTLHAHCERLARRPLLLIDNLDTLLAGLPSTHQWTLRKHLQAADGPVLIAAASRYPDATHDAKAAFYEFFRIQPLDRLEDHEVFECLRNLAQHRGDAGKTVLELLNKDPGRVAALNTLAGGNPRTLSVLYGVLESHMSADVLSQLSAMLDTFTGWYQARTEELPMQSRAVFDALALNWDPMTAATLGKTTGLDTPAVSSQLARLEKAGYVEQVSLTKSGKGRNGYQVSERFFNIWYLMRNGPRRARQSIRFLTTFLKSCFSTPERRSLAMDALNNAACDPGYTLALASSLTGSELQQKLLDHAYVRANHSPQGTEYLQLIEDLRVEHRPPTINRRNKSGSGSAAVPTSREQEAKSLFNKGWQLSSQGKSEQAIAVYDELITRFGDATEPTVRGHVASALFNKGGRLGTLGKSSQAVVVYDELLARFDDASVPSWREIVARTLLNKGFQLGALGQFEQEISVYDELLTRFADASEPGLQEPVAFAFFNKASWLATLGKSEQAIAAYDELLDRFANTTEPALRERVASALFNKGGRLGALGHFEREIAAYDELLARFGGATDASLREIAAGALFNKGIGFRALGLSDQEIAAYDELLTRFGDAVEPDVRVHTASALFNKGVRLGALGRSEQAIVIWDELLTRFGEAKEPVIRERVARALFNKGVRLGALGLSEQAIAVCDEMLARFDGAIEPILRQLVAQALLHKGVRLGLLGRSEQEITAYDELLSRFGDASERALREPVALAILSKGARLGALGRPEQAIAAYDELLTRFGDVVEPAQRGWLASALLRKASLLKNQMCDATAAQAVFEAGLAFADEPELRTLLHANLAFALGLHGGNPADARLHAQEAMHDEMTISSSGRWLLEALPVWSESIEPDWAQILGRICDAIASDDPNLWSMFNDDLYRLLSFVVTEGQGPALKLKMEAMNFPDKYAPLYHAFVAALEGDDHLLQINPETRRPAEPIHAELLRRLRKNK